MPENLPECPGDVLPGFLESKTEALTSATCFFSLEQHYTARWSQVCVPEVKFGLRLNIAEKRECFLFYRCNEGLF